MTSVHMKLKILLIIWWLQEGLLSDYYIVIFDVAIHVCMLIADGNKQILFDLMPRRK